MKNNNHYFKQVKDILVSYLNNHAIFVRQNNRETALFLPNIREILHLHFILFKKQ